jgi:hypothetical protein
MNLKKVDNWTWELKNYILAKNITNLNEDFVLSKNNIPAFMNRLNAINKIKRLELEGRCEK